MIRTTLFVVVVLIAAEAPAQKPKGEYPPPPWHLVDIWWDIGQDMPFESYSVDVDISEDVPATKNLYISPVGLGHLSKTDFMAASRPKWTVIPSGTKTFANSAPASFSPCGVSKSGCNPAIHRRVLPEFRA